ncbi:MAG TPA: hypothetical protein VIQ54_33820 [Polyangia bacterium]|jgi:hypothetical protein
MDDLWAGWFLVVLPCAIYLIFALSYFFRGRTRRDLVARLFANERIKDFYKKAFGINDSNANKIADKFLPRWYEHVLPLVLCSVIILPVAVTAVARAEFPLGLPKSILDCLKQMPPVVLAGFAGAYVWGLWSCIQRYRVVNWTPGFIHGLWVRILVGGGMASVMPFEADFKLVLAFTVGAFPVTTTLKWLRHRFGEKLGMGDEDEGAGPDWSVIQGVTPDLVERLEEADVASPTGLANADPFQVYLRTNITWRHILDLIDQAILAQYVGEKLQGVRATGVRGAIEGALVAERLRQLTRDDPVDKLVIDSAEATIAKLSVILEQPADVTRNLLQNLNEDSQVRLIANLWFEEEGKGVVSHAREEKERGLRVHGAALIGPGDKKDPPPTPVPPSGAPPTPPEPPLS